MSELNIEMDSLSPKESLWINSDRLDNKNYRQEKQQEQLKLVSVPDSPILYFRSSFILPIPFIQISASNRQSLLTW